MRTLDGLPAPSRSGRFAALTLAIAAVSPSFPSRNVHAQGSPAAATTAVAPAPGVDEVRVALDKYRDPIVAVHDGYFSTLVCTEFPEPGAAGELPYPAGGMGIHFLNPGLMGAPLDPLHPQVLLYDVEGDSLRLIAAEWFVPLATGVKARPHLFGRPFDGPMEGHHPIMPAGLHHYDLHVWLWKTNPAGMFSPTNAAVTCPKTGYSVSERAPKLVSP